MMADTFFSVPHDVLRTSMTDSKISGAEEPRAMSVRLDTVSFQIRTVVTVVSPLGFVIVTCFSCKGHIFFCFFGNGGFY